MNKELNSIGINKKPEDTKVVVAMSGGVDSSTVAGIMKNEGYRVIGITLISKRVLGKSFSFEKAKSQNTIKFITINNTILILYSFY